MLHHQGTWPEEHNALGLVGPKMNGNEFISTYIICWMHKHETDYDTILIYNSCQVNIHSVSYQAIIDCKTCLVNDRRLCDLQ